MLKLILVFATGLAVAAGCAHKGAVRVQCDGVLRPINSPQMSFPVSVVPAVPLTEAGVPQP